MKKTHRWIPVRGSWECAKVDWDDYDWIASRRWYLSATGYADGRTQGNGRKHRGELQKMHRAIMGCTRNDGVIIDHINHDVMDNRKCNLRRVTGKLNQQNRGKLNRNNTTGHRGTSFTGGRYVAQVMVDRKTIRLGRYSKLEDAIAARKAAEQKYGFRQ